MKYCPNCGSAVADSANYCPNCGRKINVLTVYDEEPADLDSGYRVVLFSRGTCTLKTTKEVLCDLLGYSTSTVTDLLDNAPVEIADELTELQAVTIAQALAEYGMDVTIVDENDRYVDFTDKANDSVFDSTGELIAAALAVFSGLSAANRVHRYRKYKKPSLLSLLFRPKYRKKPPVHIRRKIHHAPEPSRRITVQKPRKPLTTHSTKPAVQQPVHTEKPHTQQKPVHTAKPAAQSAHNTKPQTQQKPAQHTGKQPSGAGRTGSHGGPGASNGKGTAGGRKH